MKSPLIILSILTLITLNLFNGILSPKLSHATEPSETIFQDVGPEHSNYDAIMYAKSHHLIQGYDDGTFKPDNTINRAEFAKIIIEATTDSSKSTNCFLDVKEEWFAPYVCTAKSLGIVGGYPDGRFKPNSSISFIEASKMIVTAFKIPTGPDNGSWFKPYVVVLSEKNAIPITIQSFDQSVNRGEIAEIIYRLMADGIQKQSVSYAELNPIILIKRQHDSNIWIYYRSGEEVQLTTTGGRTDLCRNGSPLNYSNPILSTDERYVLITVGCDQESSEIYVKEIASMESEKVADGYQAEFYNALGSNDMIKVDGKREKTYPNPFYK